MKVQQRFILSILIGLGFSLNLFANPKAGFEVLEPASLVGSTEANFRVDEFGQAAINVPIFTPAGTAGVAPQVSLNYNSGAGNGVAGLGWSIQGASAITRCPRTDHQDGYRAPVRMDTRDAFCLNGQRLIKTSDGSLKKYRTEIEDFSEITSTQDLGNGPYQFIVKTKSGETHYYGGSKNTQFQASNSIKIRAWMIRRIVDVAGNYIEFEYKNAKENGEIVLSKIKYTGNDRQNLAPYNTINFVYLSDVISSSVSVRDDQRLSYLPDGSISRQTELLQRIEVETDNEWVRSYKLIYGVLNNGNHRLDALQECAKGREGEYSESYSSCLEPVRFEYQDDKAGVSINEGLSMNYIWHHWGVPGDFDGDGITETALDYAGHLIIAENNRWNTPSHYYSIPFTASMRAAAQVFDVTGDDKQDLIYAVNHWEWHVATMHTGVWQHYRVQNINDAHAYDTSFSDIDHDGLIDMVYSRNQVWKVAYGKGFSHTGYFFEAPRIIKQDEDVMRFTSKSPAFFIDIDGDGEQELFARRHASELFLAMKIVVDAQRNVEFKSIRQHLFDEGRITSNEFKSFGPHHYGIEHKLYDHRQPVLVDLNGDGLPELIYPHEHYWHLRLNTGKGFAQPQRFAKIPENNGNEKRGPIHIVDYNADGITDIMLPTYQYDDSLGYLKEHDYSKRVGGRIFYFDHTNQRIDFFRDFLRPDYASIHNVSKLSGDFNGDSKQTIIYEGEFANASKRLISVTSQATTFSGKLTKKIDSNGVAHTIEYKLLTDNSLHTRSEHKALPFIETPLPTTGVSQVITHDPLGDQHVEYRYKNFRSHLHRGSLGFEFIETFDPRRNVTTTTQYAQVFPIAGQPIKTTTRHGNKLISEAVNVYKYKDSNGRTHDPMSQSEPTEQYGLFPFIESTVEKKNTLLSEQGWAVAPVSETMTHFTYSSDGYGNLLESEVTVFNPQMPEQKIITKSVNEYGNSTWHKRYGRLTQTTVTKTVTDLALTSVNDDGSGDDGSGDDGAGDDGNDDGDNGGGIIILPPPPPPPIDCLPKDGYLKEPKQQTCYKFPCPCSGLGGGSGFGSSSFSTALSLGDITTGTSPGGVSGGLMDPPDNENSSTASVENLVTKTSIHTSSFTYYPENYRATGGHEGLLKSETTEPDSDKAVSKHYTYDEFANQTKVETKGKQYDAVNNRMTDELSRYTVKEYDNRGRFVIKETNLLGHTNHIEYDETLGKPTKMTDRNGLVVKHKYDGLGRIYQTVNPNKTYINSTIVSCARSGECKHDNEFYFNKIQKFAGFQADGDASYQFFDAMGREVRTLTPGWDGNVETRKKYDQFGRVEYQSMPYYEGNAAEYTQVFYDTFDRKTREVDPDGKETLIRYTGPYESKIVNAKGHVKTTRVNLLGKTSAVIDAVAAIFYHYDADGNLIRLLDSGSSRVDMAYDIHGHKISMDDSDKGQWTYHYNAFGELIQQTDARGVVIRNTYDSLGRLIQRHDNVTQQSSIPVQTSCWTYDSASNGLGKLARSALYDGLLSCNTVDIRNALHAKTYRYDGYGRTTSTDTMIKQYNTNTIDTYMQTTQYDPTFGRVSHVGLPDGLTLENVYRADGKLEQVRNADIPSRVYQKIEDMDALGNVTISLQNNGVKTIKNYNSRNGQLENLSILNLSNMGGNILRNYQYDAIGNLIEQTGNSDASAEIYTYDDVNRIKSFKLAGYNRQTFSYDSMGNILSKSDIGSDYRYGEGNAGVHAVSSIYHLNQKKHSFVYDANGNMTSSTNHQDYSVRNIAYSAFEKPISIQKGSTKIEFYYGADRNRYRRVDSKNNGSIKIDTTYLGKSFEHIRHTGGIRNGQTDYKFYVGDTVITETVFANGNEQTKTNYLHRDHLGSVVAITDDARQAKRYRYDPFGKQFEVFNNNFFSARAIVTAQEVNRGFTGHEMLSEVGLIHMNGRIYDPEIARFVQADPFIQAPNQSQNLNRYSYVMNNPMNASDPSGFFFKKIVNAAFKVSGSEALFKFLNKRNGTRALGQIGAAVADVFGCAGYCSAYYSYGSTYQATGSLNAGFKAGAKSYASSWMFAQIGAHFGEGGQTFASATASVKAKWVLAHAIAGGISSELNGGKFGHGFVSAGLTKALNINYIVGGDDSAGWTAIRITSAAVIGGTISELTGGKFKNGAITAAYAQAFNGEKERRFQLDQECRVCSIVSSKRQKVRHLAIKDHTKGGMTDFMALIYNQSKGLNQQSATVPTTPETVLAIDLLTAPAHVVVGIFESMITYTMSTSSGPGTFPQAQEGHHIYEVLYESGFSNGRSWEFGGYRYSVLYHLDSNFNVVNEQLNWSSNGYPGSNSGGPTR
ncbi:MAG: hypothetical protein HWE27_11070 [Gammaproteobacteria bacterium]|nr:hypothetical protein [Gammaproteobacteria bacterium]